MNRIPVHSSAVKSLGHEGDVLQVEYQNGGVYELQGVTRQEYEDLLAADSLGRALQALRSQCAACVKVEDEHGE